METEALTVLVKKDPRWTVKPSQVRRIAKVILAEEGYRLGILSIMLVGKRKARGLNIKWRGQDYIPQVLAFPASEQAMVTKSLGDVVLCLPLLREEAVRKNSCWETILEDWLRHGIKSLKK